MLFRIRLVRYPLAVIRCPFSLTLLPMLCSLAIRLCAPVAQLDRVLDYESRGRMFESCRVYHIYQQAMPLDQGGFFVSRRSLYRKTNYGFLDICSTNSKNAKIIATKSDENNSTPRPFIKRLL